MNHQNRIKTLFDQYEALINEENTPLKPGNGIFNRFQNPIITAAHTPVFWRYDLNPETNPFLMERQGVNATFNSGALEFNKKICLVVRVEGYDRKSFFAIADSETGIDGFKFWDYPITMPETEDPDTNVYDMRLTQHQDGWIYGLFCTERRDKSAPEFDQSSADAQCGIARTKDLINWERLPDLKTELGITTEEETAIDFKLGINQEKP